MLAILALVVVAVLVAVLAYAATLPGGRRIDRATRVHAAPAAVAAHVADFHRWQSWSPFETLDPAMQRAFGGPATGPGAIYAWEGNRKVGKGRMEIVDASPARIRIQLDFERPMKGHNVADFTFQRDADATLVRWAMYCPATPFFGKVLGLFVDLDGIVGRSFETGLANLKALAERESAAAAQRETKVS